MNKTLIALSFISLFFCNFQCNDCEDEIHDQSSFTANIIPLQENYDIGDTILIGARFSALIPLENSKTTFDNSNQIMTFVIQIFEVKPNNELIIDGIQNFDVISRIGQINPSSYYDNRLAKEITNTCDDENCEFQIEINLRKKGIYCFSMLNSRFGEMECQNLSLVKNDFGLDDNNFEICQEINTNRFRVLEGGSFFSNPEEIESFYFFRVD